MINFVTNPASKSPYSRVAAPVQPIQSDESPYLAAVSSQAAGPFIGLWDHSA